MDQERFGKLRNYYDVGALSNNQQQLQQPQQAFHHQQQPLQQQKQLPSDMPLSHHQERRVQPLPTSPDTLASANLNQGNMGYYNAAPSKASLTSANASTKSLVNEDGIAPFSNLSTAVASTINANHSFDAKTIADHDTIMQFEGQKYNAAAEVAGIPTRINDSEECNQQLKGEGELTSPTAFLDDALILEEKAKQQELERRIEEKNSKYNKQQEVNQKGHEELLVGPAAIGGESAGLAQRDKLSWDQNGEIMREPFDETASGDNFVAMGKPRASKLNAAGRTPAAQRVIDQQQRQAAGLPADHKKEAPQNEVFGALKAQISGHHPKKPDEAVPLAAQTYDGMPPKPIQRILDDTPDRWFEQYRCETAERRAQKETQRRVELSRKEKETDGSLTTKISAVFDDTKASIKRSKQEHDLKAEDKKLANHHQRARERMTKYFPLHTNERFTCAFDAQALHNHLPLAGHLILTDSTLCFLGKGQEEISEIVHDKHPSSDSTAATHTATHKEHILVKEAIPLINIASIVMGAVVKNNGKVFIMDGSDEIVVADALQLFLKDGRVVQLRSFSHPTVTKKGMSYDGRTVPSMNRFLNFLDHNWRAAGGDNGMNNQQKLHDIPARE
eukprot:GILJ01009659.1.p1 GENE.GILJ01009659.1~~GILJ01009659.1.p1  ORF type:complete len:724 (-),score=187.63 GILJ01009659.1:199-2049(-)